MTTDYAGNSHKKKGSVPGPAKEEKNVKPVVTQAAIIKKKPLGRKVKDLFIAADFRSTSQYVFANVLIPAAKNMLWDVASATLKRSLFGEQAARYMDNPGRTQIQYHTPPQRRSSLMTTDPRGPQYGSAVVAHRPQPQPAYDYFFTSHTDAQRVLEAMVDIAEVYTCVTVADLKELCSLPTQHTDNKWGWEHLVGAQVLSVREGYILDLPPAIPV